MNKTIKFYVVMILLIMQNCATQVTAFDTLIYTDQNNNRFKIENLQLSYTAVKKIHSSTGQYSGGSNYSVQITKESYLNIKEKALSLIKDTANHAQKRLKTTSVLELNSKNQNYKVILLSSEQREVFENLLRSFK